MFSDGSLNTRFWLTVNVVGNCTVISSLVVVRIYAAQLFVVCLPVPCCAVHAYWPRTAVYTLYQCMLIWSAAVLHVPNLS